MTAVDDVVATAPPSWKRKPLWAIARRVDRRGRPDAERLSVYRDYGVIPTASRDDNFNKPSEDLSTYKFVRCGDLVLNKMKTWQGSLAVSDHEGIVSPAYYVCELTTPVNPKWLHYLLRSQPYVAAYGAMSKGIRPNQWDLPFEEFRTIPVLLPPLDDQQRIADYLDAETARIDALITKKRSLAEYLESRLDAQLFHVYLGESAPSAPLKRRWQVIDCKHRTPTYVTEGFPVVSPGDIQRGRLDVSRCHRFVDDDDFQDLADASRRCRVGDIVYSRNASIGVAAYIDTDAPFTMGQDVCRITSRDRSQLFLAHYLNYVATPQIEAIQVGSTFTRVNIEMILDVQVPEFSLDRERQIGEIADSVINAHRQAVSALEQSVKLLTERRQALITAAVTDEFAVPGLA